MLDLKRLKLLTADISVLYVEDDKELRDITAEYFRKFFLHVDTAENGIEGLKLFQVNKYDLVVSDIQMPHMNGLEMVTKIREIDSEQEVIIVSAYSDEKYFIDAIRLGVNSYIIKPINFEQLNTTLYRTANKIVHFRENALYKNHLEELVQERTEKLLKLEYDKIENFEQTLRAFVTMIESRDTYTGGHSERVAKYSKLIAQKLGCSAHDCDFIYQAGILHDIGKISTPDSILLKPGQLSSIEFKLIKSHVTVGHELLSKVPMYSEMSKIILCHHEKYDGSGYPNGLAGEEIPFLARIMIVADAFDAMTTNRIYKGRKTIPQALDELNKYSGIQFHPEIVEAACVVLKDTSVPDSISQLPVSDLERERFSYFYRDQLTGAYNSEYLDYMLSSNKIEKKFQFISMINLHNFDQYNTRFNWAKGDFFLKVFAQNLIALYEAAMIFRVHGDDFILLTNLKPEINIDQLYKMEIFIDSRISISKRYIDLNENDVENLDAIKDWLL